MRQSFIILSFDILFVIESLFMFLLRELAEDILRRTFYLSRCARDCPYMYSIIRKRLAPSVNAQKARTI